MFLVETWLNRTTGVATLRPVPQNTISISQSDKTGKEEVLPPFSIHIYLYVMTLTWTNLHNWPIFEYLALELKAEPPVLIIALYWPPKYSSVFLQEFSELISLGITRYGRFILNGDLNIHINKKNHRKAMELVNLLESFELT